jgi:GNAT superfamily N-acetyltransferase
MYFHPLPWLEYGEAMAEAVECVWQEAGEDRQFDKNILLEDAAVLPTIIGFVEYEPAGFLQFGMEPGRIALLCTHPGCRQAGLGAQLIGQAVIAARANGADRLYIALPEKNPYRQFFRDNGFTSAGQTQGGREIFEKHIRFDPSLPDG